MANVKGSSIRGMIESLQRAGDASRALLGERFQHVLDEPVVASKWYPEELLVELYRALVKRDGRGDGEVLRELGESGARSQFERTYSDLARTSMLDVKCKVLWSAQHDTGELELSERTDSSVRYELTGFGNPNRELCLVLDGYFAESFRITGADSVEVTHERCQVRGDDRCVWMCRWTPQGSSSAS